jgi:DNA modification methylase
VWAKDNAGLGSFYRSMHELIFVYKNGTAPHINQIQLGKYGRNRTNIWRYPGVNSFARSANGEHANLLALHPTVKSVAMVADALLDCTNRGACMLDPFLGSGTSILAAERTGRFCLGMELEPKYVDTSIRRWQAYTGQKAVHAVTGETFDERETRAKARSHVAAEVCNGQ